MGGLHAEFAPSSADRVTDCTASYLLTLKEADRPKRYSAEGTCAHRIADRCMRTGDSPVRFLNSVEIIDDRAVRAGPPTLDQEGVFEITVDEEMVDGVERYIAWCVALPGDHYPERKVDISRWTPIPNQFGTSDHAAASDGRLVITDLKYGAGVPVAAYDNKQLILYALGVIDELDWWYEFEEIQIRICQPRRENFDVWTTTKAHLLERGEFIRQKFFEAYVGPGVFAPSKEVCQFCKVSGRCRAQQEFLDSKNALIMDQAFGEFETPIALLTLDELVEAYKLKSLYDLRLHAIKDHLQGLLDNGDHVPGIKQATGRSSRDWYDEEIAKKFVLQHAPRHLAIKEKFVSPAMAEKLVKGEARVELAKLIRTKPGKPTIADADSQRPDYSASIAAAFS